MQNVWGYVKPTPTDPPTQKPPPKQTLAILVRFGWNLVGRSNLGSVTVYKLVEWLGVCLAHPTNQETTPNKFPWWAAPKQPSWTQFNFPIFSFSDNQLFHNPFYKAIPSLTMLVWNNHFWSLKNKKNSFKINWTWRSPFFHPSLYS